MDYVALCVRFALGGAIVSVFAAIGSAFQPKSFAGLFGGAPSVALASLAFAFTERSGAYASALARSMVGGAVALGLYSATCAALLAVRSLPVWLGAIMAWLGWAAAAAAIYGLCT